MTKPTPLLLTSSVPVYVVLRDDFFELFFRVEDLAMIVENGYVILFTLQGTDCAANANKDTYQPDNYRHHINGLSYIYG